jgi:hypothetical protein
MATHKKDPAAVKLGRRGGLKGGSKGGKARWRDVSKKERSEIMRRVVLTRWSKRQSPPSS